MYKIVLDLKKKKFDEDVYETNLEQQQRQIKYSDLEEEQDKHYGQAKRDDGHSEENLFNLHKVKKNEAPLNGFLNYYAFRTEEAKMKRKVAIEHSDVTGTPIELPNRKSLHVGKTFKQYMVAKNFQSDYSHITQKEYNKIQWINVVPEIICDILCYIVCYFHYRTDTFSRDVYENMLTGQI